MGRSYVELRGIAVTLKEDEELAKAMLDVVTHPKTRISATVSCLEFPSFQLVLESPAEGAMVIHEQLAVGKQTGKGWVVFHGNRLVATLVGCVDPGLELLKCLDVEVIPWENVG